MFLLAFAAAVLDWRPWEDSQQKFPFASFFAGVLKLAPSAVAAFGSCCLSEQMLKVCYDWAQYVFRG